MKQELRIRNKKFRIKSIILASRSPRFGEAGRSGRNSLFIIRKSDGFTLIELLVVILVIFAVGVLIISVLVSALRGANKTNTIDLVRKNGNSAISQMSRMIRYAQSFDGVSTDGSSPQSYQTNCTTPPPIPPPTNYHYLKITSFDRGQTIFSCLDSTLNPPGGLIASNSAPLIDTGSVDVSNCYFTCTQSDIFSPPTIGINFDLKQKGAPQFFENRDSASFQTSVSIRNY